MTAGPGAAAPADVRAEVLAIGDELVHGSQLDTNSQWLARELETAGARIDRCTVVGDDPDTLAGVMAEACQRADLVVATGGLGPTLDDRTRDVAAALAGGPLWFDEPSWQHIRQLLLRRRRPVPESNRRQAHFPPGATVLTNPVGTAPGFRLPLHRAVLFALPGVPREMQRMVADHVLPWLCALPGRQPVARHTMRVVGPSEAQLGEVLAGFLAAGCVPAVGITASAGQLTVRIVARGASAALAAERAAATAAQIRPLLGGWLVAEGEAELHEVVVRALQERGATLALAESCTGGLAAAQLVDVPGASAVFLGGLVAYSDASKMELLGVDAALLGAHGAVSEPVAEALAAGAAQRFGAQIGAAVTGIAGPDGGTADKPVGTVCFGLWRAGTGRAWTVRVPDFGRGFVRRRSVFELWSALLAELRR